MPWVFVDSTTWEIQGDSVGNTGLAKPEALVIEVLSIAHERTDERTVRGDGPSGLHRSPLSFKPFEPVGRSPMQTGFVNTSDQVLGTSGKFTLPTYASNDALTQLDHAVWDAGPDRLPV